MSEERKWTPRQLRTFGAVMVGGVVLAIAVTAILSAATDVGAPKAAFVGVLVAVIAMYAAIITLGIRERRTPR